MGMGISISVPQRFARSGGITLSDAADRRFRRAMMTEDDEP
jgi:hypothetical protein